MCIGGSPSVPPPPPPPPPPEPPAKLPDKAVQDAKTAEQRRAAAMFGAGATDLTKGDLAGTSPATQAKKLFGE